MRRWLRTVALIVTLAVAACSSHAKSGPRPAALPHTPAAARPYWLINSRALAMIADAPGVREVLDNPRTFVVVPPTAASDPVGWNVSRVLSFTSYRSLHAALTKGPLPNGVSAVLYDPERWRFTPTDEQRNPGRFVALAARDAHARDLRLIATPATNLAQLVSPGTAYPYDTFLEAEILGEAARHADVIDVQAQGSLVAPAAYAGFVKRAVSQIRAASPDTLALAGLSTNPAGPAVSLDQLVQAVTATRLVVDGYWLNIPVPGPFCPKCNAARPDLAVALLSTVFNEERAP